MDCKSKKKKKKLSLNAETYINECTAAVVSKLSKRRRMIVLFKKKIHCN